MSNFTRLSWNSDGWKKPSGVANKCYGTDKRRLYECLHGFGWEEWLFHFIEHEDGYCYGFLQCFNDSQRKSEIIHDLHLYTRKCENNCKPGSSSATYYVGRFTKLERLGPEHQNSISQLIRANAAKMRAHLQSAGLTASIEEFNDMLESGKIFNIRFKKIDLFVPIGEIQKRPIKIPHPFYKFMLYKLPQGCDFIKEAITYYSITT